MFVLPYVSKAAIHNDATTRLKDFIRLTRVVDLLIVAAMHLVRSAE